MNRIALPRLVRSVVGLVPPALLARIMRCPDRAGHVAASGLLWVAPFVLLDRVLFHPSKASVVAAPSEPTGQVGLAESAR
jgi:hypothetical protein